MPYFSVEIWWTEADTQLFRAQAFWLPESRRSCTDSPGNSSCEWPSAGKKARWSRSRRGRCGDCSHPRSMPTRPLARLGSCRGSSPPSIVKRCRACRTIRTHWAESCHRRRGDVTVAAGKESHVPGYRSPFLHEGALHALIQPVAVSAHCALVVTEEIPWCRAGRGSATCRVFPFGLAQQPIGLSGRLREPCYISLAVDPVQACSRIGAVLPVDTRIAP